MLDASCSGAFSNKSTEAKWNLIERIQKNTEDWEIDKGYEEERLLEVLHKHRGAIGYTLDDLKGISPSICEHTINLEPDAKQVVDHQRWLNPKMKDIVRTEILKLLSAGERSANLGAMASPKSPKDKFLVNVINPYLAEVKRHPQTLWAEDVVLHKEVLKGPVKEGITRARLEEVEQEVFKYKLMIEHGVEANYDIIVELKREHEEEMKEV
ncbi:hypothetical protein ZWY2020_009121 [Hordeum vulgare]|nr:hypothetical protein ZWY2020_009121 [Hordeum vulgare]